MLAAYFSHQGATIQQGAGEYFGDLPPVAQSYRDGSLGRRRTGTRGLGDYFDGVPPYAQSFSDGSFGGELGAEYPGPLTNFRDGSLGALGMPLWLNGKQIDGTATIVHGDSPTAGGGVLGPDAGGDGGALGPGAATVEDPRVAVTPWGDGVLGAPASASSAGGNLESYNDGIMSLTGLGAVTAPNVLDLTDPAAVRELKAALAYAYPPALADTATYDEAFYANPLWDAKATKLATDWAKAFTTGSTASLLTSASGGQYPTSSGVASIIATGVGAPIENRPAWFQSSFPILFAYYSAAIAAQMDMSKFSVSKPFFTAEEAAGGGGGMKMSTMALIGLGVVGAIGAALVITHVKKKPMRANRRRARRR
jgi:hypothetical protein